MQRLFQTRRISRFGVRLNILEIAYKSLVESVLTYNLTSWYGHLNFKLKNSLVKVTNIVVIIGRPQSKLREFRTSRCIGEAECIFKDPAILKHTTLYEQFVLFPSGRWFLMPSAKTNIYKIYFVPAAVGFLNQKVWFSLMFFNVLVCFVVGLCVCMYIWFSLVWSDIFQPVVYRNSLCASQHCRLTLLFQVQEIVLRKLRCTHSNIWDERFWKCCKYNETTDF